MDVSFNCWKTGFEGDKVNHVLKVTLIVDMFIPICLYSYKNNIQNISTRGS